MALAGLPEAEALARIDALVGESIYDGTSRLAQPDEVWNFARGDGLEKCLLAANAVGGDAIAVDGGVARLFRGGKTLFEARTSKRPLEAEWLLRR
jgi:hypothetical protein